MKDEPFELLSIYLTYTVPRVLMNRDNDVLDDIYYTVSFMIVVCYTRWLTPYIFTRNTFVSRFSSLEIISVDSFDVFCSFHRDARLSKQTPTDNEQVYLCPQNNK